MPHTHEPTLWLRDCGGLLYLLSQPAARSLGHDLPDHPSNKVAATKTGSLSIHITQITSKILIKHIMLFNANLKVAKIKPKFINSEVRPHDFSQVPE